MIVAYTEIPAMAGGVPRPLLDVAVEDQADAPVPCLVDTGAVNTLLPGWLADAAGIDLGASDQRDLAVGGGVTAAAFTAVQLTVRETCWQAPVGFCEPWPYSWGLLGYEAFFRYFTVTFRAATTSSRSSPPEPEIDAAIAGRGRGHRPRRGLRARSLVVTDDDDDDWRGRMRAVVFEGAGDNEVVHVRERPDPVPQGTEVVVAVRHAGLNPADLLQRRGHYPAPPGSPPDVPGLEVAGEVATVGDRVRHLAPGHRVLGLVGGGGLASRVLVDESNLVLSPDVLDDAAAAAVPEAFMTAHDALRTQAAMTPGERVLVQGATGGVGTAALQIVTVCGARALGVTRSAEGRGLVASLGAEPVDDADFVAQVRELTAGDGVDVVVELVGAPHFPGNLDVLATQGRIVIVGVGAGANIDLSLLTLMGRRARVIGTVLRARSIADKAAAVRAFERELLPLFAAGALRPVIDATYPVDAVHDAFDHLETAGKNGKILVELSH